MTLLAAVQSLAIIEMAAVSWINIRPIDRQHLAVFTVALLLPFVDPALPEEFRGGEVRFWPDQARLLDSEPPIQDQILELHRTKVLGNLASIKMAGVEGAAPALWIIKTHWGSREERLSWMRSVITMEGRAARE